MDDNHNRQLRIVDLEGNRGSCVLSIPHDMDRWRCESFSQFLASGIEAASVKGFLPQPADPFGFEHFRQLIVNPESTYNRRVTFHQEGRLLNPSDHIHLRNGVNELRLGRDFAAPPPSIDAISLESRNRRAFRSLGGRFTRNFDELFDFRQHTIRTKGGQQVESIEYLIGRLTETLDATNQTRFWHRACRVVYDAPFENFSKIVADRPIRAGFEMWANLHNGYGGVCAEKTAAMLSLCHLVAARAVPVLGAESAIPQDFATALKSYLQSDGEVPLPVDIQHHMIEIDIDGHAVLVDVTNGNLPFVMLDSDDADRWIRGGFRGRMLYRVDRLFLRRAAPWVGDALLTLGEYHVPDMHTQYIFDQGLGLHVTANEFVGVYFDWGGERSRLQQNYYSGLARKAGFPYPYFIHANNLHAIEAPPLKKLIRDSLTTLRLRYGERASSGDFTFVVQPLVPNFWTRPRISRSLRRMLQ